MFLCGLRCCGLHYAFSVMNGKLIYPKVHFDNIVQLIFFCANNFQKNFYTIIHFMANGNCNC